MRTNAQQVKHLKDRVERVKARAHAQRYKLREAMCDLEPKTVRDARALIASWEKRRERAYDAQVKRLRLGAQDINDACFMVREKLLFATPDEALAEVQKLEKLYPQPKD